METPIMEKISVHEHYPLWIVLLSNLFALLVYVMGMFVLSGFGVWWSLAFMAYFLVMEFRLLKKSCVDCYYHGKRCSFGKGRLSSWFFKRGDPQRFARRTASWKDVIPDFLIIIIPLAGGIILLVREFDWLLLIIVAVMTVLYFGGNAVIRGTFACRFCKQKEIGCPADRIFNKDKKGRPA